MRAETRKQEPVSKEEHVVKVKIGLEIHVYLFMENRTKLFCECKIDKSSPPNTNICPICTSQPGAKPMLTNKEAVEKIIAISLMLNCKINKRFLFQRKHYSWPDLPSGYQRTMSGAYSTPTAVNGEFHGIRISDVHLEEDPAKWDPETGKVDYNRSGLPLAEIVTAPDFKTAAEVQDWLNKLLVTLSYVHAVEKNAGIKCDVNVSISPDFTRTEIKNVNSITAIGEAIAHEIRRLAKQAQEGIEHTQQTRMWDDEKKETVFMRSKETALDYMFIPEPDLPVIKIHDTLLAEIQKKLPERPADKLKKYIALKIDKTDAEIISSEIILAALFDKVIKKVDPVFASKWFRRDVIAAINANNIELDELSISAEHLIDWFSLLNSGELSPLIAKDILEKFITENFDVRKYVHEHKLSAVKDSAELEKLCEEAVAQNPIALKEYLAGKEKALNAIVGSVMAQTKGKADPAAVNRILKEIIEKKK
ncbi:MAG: Asp-tRNA(Asn)/Glu-tRNA(Gln) amidotransferase subunit GatB [Nanoarchaeota archaeon]